MKRLLALSAFLLTSGAAFAADPVYSPMSAYDWSGLWVGVHGGHVSGTITGTTSGVTQVGPSGADVGVHAVYNWQHENWVHGLYAAVPFVSASGSVSGTAVKLDWAVAGAYRIGYAMDRWLPYALAGFVVGGGTANGASNTHLGYTLGVGVDYAFADRWSAGVRYAFVSMEKKAYNGSLPLGWDGHSFVATLNFKLY